MSSVLVMMIKMIVIMMIEMIELMLTPTHVLLPAVTDQQTMNATF